MSLVDSDLIHDDSTAIPLGAKAGDAPALTISLDDSLAKGVCALCGKRAGDSQQVPTGWLVSPPVPEAELPGFLICPECLHT